MAVRSTKQAGVFSGKMCSNRRKNHGCSKKTEGTSSAIYGVGSDVKYCELKRCADRSRSTTDNKDEVVEGKFSNLNFLPSTNIWYFVSQDLIFTSVELNRFAKQAKLFQKRQWSFPAKKNTGCPKVRAISRQEKMVFFTPPPPRQVVLELPSPSPRVCTDRATGVRWRHN